MTTTTTTVRPPEDFFLPAGYRQQTAAHSRDRGLGDGNYWTPERIANASKYQYHVYRWAAELITERQLASVLDVGCGPGTKLRDHIAPVCDDITGLDQPAGVEAATSLRTPGVFHVVDLEHPLASLARTFDLIISADVVEHLIDPDPMLGMIREYCGERSLVLLSTPDRARLHGADCMESNKPEHVREWAAAEFCRYLDDRGFEILEERFLPAADEPASHGLEQEAAFRDGRAPTSPRRCHAVLCRPSR